LPVVYGSRDFGFVRAIVGFRLRSDGHHGNTRVNGYDILNTSGAHNAGNIRLDSGSSEAFGLAPALEYNLNRNWACPSEYG
jgi:hypothetical protein